MNLGIFKLDRAVILVQGEDVVNFLQGILSNDMNLLGRDRYIYSFMLTPQGRFLYDFFLVRVEEGVLIDCNMHFVDEICRKLQMYKLRSDVEITRTDYNVYASRAQMEGLSFTDPRSQELGFRSITLEEMECDDQFFELYHSRRMSLLIADGNADMIYGKTLPLDISADAIGAISFTKGCYVGQEVTARMNWRGSRRKKLYLLEGVAAKESELMHQEYKVGIALGSFCSKTLGLLSEAEAITAISSGGVLNTVGGDSVRIISEGLR